MARATSHPAGRERRSPTPDAARKRTAIHHLKAAMVEDRIHLLYQPIVSAADSRVERVEALLRWRNPKQEKQTVSDLIWAAERSPVIFNLENWILDQSFRAASAWKDKLPGVRVNVNLSAREFPRADLVGRVTRRLAAAHLDPMGVGLEITETSGIDEFDEVSDQIDRLVVRGIELWLDDFGTGHSSLEWLSHLPLHGLKIPGTFVERLHDEKRCQAIVIRVIELAHDLGLKVIAEGVETAEQRDFLAARGCDFFQGYLFYAAMPAARLPSAVKAGTSRSKAHP